MPAIRVQPGFVAVDMHVHTIYSCDAFSTLPQLVKAAESRGLGALAITDHNQIEGALRLREVASFPVIVGEEIKTLQGEITGLFLEREIPKKLPIEETIAAIREQNGLVYLPHPFDSIRNSTILPESIQSIIGQVDVVEVLNARVMRRRHNDLAEALARAHDLPRGAGSDAHTPAELGAAYVAIPACDFADPRSFLEALKRGEVGGAASSPLVHIASTVAKIGKRLRLVAVPPSQGQAKPPF